MPKLSIDLAVKLRELRDRFGLEVVEERYDESNFGNANVVLVAGDFAMRIVRDRGQLFIDLANPNQKWVDADRKSKAWACIQSPNPFSPSTNSLMYLPIILKARVLQSL